MTMPMYPRSPAGGASCSATRRLRSSRGGSRSRSRKAVSWRWSGTDPSPSWCGESVMMGRYRAGRAHMVPFLRNQWYTAATSVELGEKPLARVICNEPVVIFRGQDGNVAVLSDRCPHRKAPLSSGEVVGNDIQCGYHGIRFAADGTCTHVPGNAAIGRNFRARYFPAREIHGLVFVWPGEPSLADPALIPDFSENVKPDWTGVHGTLHVKANYQLLIDNILDLTHVVFVHKTTLAGGGVAETPLEVEVEGDVVRAQRLMHNVDTAPIYKAARNLHGKIDRWQFLEFQPPIYARITLGAREAGSDLPFGTPTVSLAFDRAALAARRIIKRKLEEEAQAAAASAKASSKRVPVRGADATEVPLN